MSAIRHRAGVWLVLTLALVLALGLRLYRLEAQSLWIDEVLQLRTAGLPLGELMGGFVPRADGGPLSLLLTHFVVDPAAPEWSARLPSVLAGTAGVLVLYLVTARLLPAPIPVLAAVLLAASPLHLWYSQEARWYALWGTMASLSYLVLVWAMQSRRMVAWLCYGVTALLAVYTFVLTPLVLAMQVSTVWLLRRFERPFRAVSWRWGAGVVVGVVTLLPLAFLVASHFDATTGTPGRATSPAALPYTAFAYAVGFSLGPTLEYLHTGPTFLAVVVRHPTVLVVALVFAPLLGLGTIALVRHREATAVLVPWLFGPPLLVFVLALVTDVAFNVRYTIAALPAFFVVLALGIHETGPRWQGVAFTLVGLCFARSIWNYHWDPRFAKEDVRAAMATIRDSPGVPVVALGQVGVAVQYYAHGDVRVVALGGCDEQVAQDRLRKAGLGHARWLWVMLGRDFQGRAQPCLAQLTPTYRTRRRHEFPGLDLQLLERRDG